MTDQKTVEIEVKIGRLEEESVALRMILSFLIRWTVSSLEVPKDSLKQTVISAFQSRVQEAEIDEGRSQRIQSIVLTMLDSAFFE